MPSARLLSLAAQQHKKGDYRWIAWKFRISQDRLEEMAIARPNKQARIEALGLSSVLFDGVATIEISNAEHGHQHSSSSDGSARYGSQYGGLLPPS